MEEQGLPTYEQYAQLRDAVTDYTSGHLLVTSWRWNTADVDPNESAGLCVGDKDDTKSAYWSCWEYKKREDGMFDDTPKSYLVNPSEFTKSSRLHDYKDLAAEGSFPGMFGGWLCLPPVDILMETYTDCMRFLPRPEKSSSEDMLFETGPIRVMTYLTSRADDDTMMVEGNETMTERRDDVFEEFTVDLMGAWSGISAAGLALASAIALMNF